MHLFFIGNIDINENTFHLYLYANTNMIKTFDTQ